MSRLGRVRCAGGSGRALALALALVGQSGCNDSAADDEQEEDDDDDEPVAVPPVIVEPTEVTISAAEREDITIAAADLLPTTRAELDGVSWSLSEPGPVVRAGQTLSVPLGGGLVVGEHELSLVHYVEKKELRSEPLVIRVEAAELSPLVASLAPELVGAGSSLNDAGPGERLLGVVDDATQTIELRLGGWATPGVTVALPGLIPADGPVGGRVDLILTEVEQARWLITTWLADGGARALARVTLVDEDGQLGEPGEPLEVWNLADAEHRALLGPHELAIDHGVALLDRMLVIAVEARRDAEAQTPGDRVLVTRWLTTAAALADPQVLRGPGGRDLDLPARARLWLDLGPPDPTLSLRVALAYPWLLELGGNGLPIVSSDPGEAVDVPGSAVWMASADGALGSRQAFALELEGEQARVRALRIDRFGASSFVETPLVDLVDLPATPSAPPSLAMIAGSPTLLIPFGVGMPAWALRSTGESVLLDSLAELGCDALALEQPDADGEGDSATVACIAGGELRVGALGVN